MKTYETSLTVRYAETDQMGIVHHSRYYPWFEVARTELLKESGLSYGEMERQGVLMPLVESHCRYIFPAKYEDVILIRTKLEELSPVKVTFQYDVLREKDAVLLAQGYTLMAFTNPAFKPVNLKKYHPKMWEFISSLK